MSENELRKLAERIEAASPVGEALAGDTVRALRMAFPEPTRLLGQDAQLLASTDEALRVVDAALPGWEIDMKGIAREPDGHWTCTLREQGALDDDEVIGIGQAPSLPRALLAALVRIAAVRHGG